jgi:hypothetical protein
VRRLQSWDNVILPDTPTIRLSELRIVADEVKTASVDPYELLFFKN